MFDGLPPYDPSAARKAESLCAQFGALVKIYNDCSYPKRGDNEIYTSCMPQDRVMAYESGIRRAMLASCETLADFKQRIYSAEPPRTRVEKTIRLQLCDAFDRRVRMPYARENHAMPWPFQSWENMGVCILEYDDFFPRGDGKKYSCKTMAVAEIAPDRLNLCFTVVPGNDMRSQIGFVADVFYRLLEKDCGREVLKGRRVDVYMHTPEEISFHGRDEFCLIDAMHPEITDIGPQRMPLMELPRSIDYLFYCHQAELSDRYVGGGVYNDFRAFSLRAM